MLGLQELILVLGIFLIVFGPKKLPEMAKELGRVVQAFNKARTGIVETTKSAMKDTTDVSESVIKIAGNLGIETEGKSVPGLLQEIERKIVKN